jgi:hypothetical protein
MEWKPNKYSDYEGKAEWLVPESYSEAPRTYEEEVNDPDEPFIYLDENGDTIIDLSDIDGLGFLIEGEENIFPDHVSVLPPATSTIDLTGLEMVSIEELVIGDVVVIRSSELLLEVKLDDEALEDAEDGSLYPLGFDFYFNGKFADEFLGRRISLSGK